MPNQLKQTQPTNNNNKQMSDPIKVIVLYMIKNESRIITRSIQSALKIADAICVSDTGSTDNTVQILKDFYPTLSVPAKTYDHPWTNFGINRSKSFNDAKQFCHELNWDPTRTYVLAIDAEGHDAEVIKGADEVLRRQGARIVEFECVGRPRLCGWGRAPAP
jgi:glycosyltransferase involved in cell wall biosynthesis